MSEQTAVASMCCVDCGKVISNETTLSEILDFVASAAANGWTFNEKGFVCCPECDDERGPVVDRPHHGGVGAYRRSRGAGGMDEWTPKITPP